jgi:hypothetical protein
MTVRIQTISGVKIDFFKNSSILSSSKIATTPPETELLQEPEVFEMIYNKIANQKPR